MFEKTYKTIKNSLHNRNPTKINEIEDLGLKVQLNRWANSTKDEIGKIIKGMVIE